MSSRKFKHFPILSNGINLDVIILSKVILTFPNGFLSAKDKCNFIHKYAIKVNICKVIRPYAHTVLVLIKLTKFAVALRLRCGCGKLTLCLYFIIFAVFKNVVHSLEPGETPSYSASHQAPNCVHRS